MHHNDDYDVFEMYNNNEDFNTLAQLWVTSYYEVLILDIISNYKMFYNVLELL